MCSIFRFFLCYRKFCAVKCFFRGTQTKVFGDKPLCRGRTIRTFYFKWATLFAHITVEVFIYRHLEELILLTVHFSVPPIFYCSCTFSVETNKNDRAKSCWIGRHHLIHTWPRHCFFALCGRGWVWKLGRCCSQACADKYFRERTSPHLSASGHRASVPLTHGYMKYRYKQANTLMRTNCIKELQSTGNLSPLPTAVTPKQRHHRAAPELYLQS